MVDKIAFLFTDTNFLFTLKTVEKTAIILMERHIWSNVCLFRTPLNFVITAIDKGAVCRTAVPINYGAVT